MTGASVPDRALSPSATAPVVAAHPGNDPSRDTYRGWAITWDYGCFGARGPNYEASWEGPEDGWVASGGSVEARTRDDLVVEIDAWIEEHPEDQA